MKRFLVLPLVLTGLLASGQSGAFQTKWGKEFAAPRSSTVGDIIGFDNTSFYVLKNSVRGLLNNQIHAIEKFDNNLNLVKSIELELIEAGNKAYLEYFLHLDGRLIMFTSYPDQTTKRNVLYAQRVNKQSLMPEKNKVKLAEINYEGNSRRNSGSFSFRVSNDSSKILVFNTLPYGYNEPQQFGLIVLDKQMNVLWQKDITLPYRDELFDVESFRVDNQGNAYMLGLLYKDKRRDKRRGAPNYEFKVFSYTDGGGSTQAYSVNVPDRFLTDMQIGIRNNGDIVCAGFYSETGKLSIRGTFFLLIDAVTNEIKTRSFKEFDIDFITQNMTEREVEKAKRREEKGGEVELFEYDLDKLIVRSDGGAMLIGEQYFVQTRTLTQYVGGRPSVQTVSYYYYNDIIMVNINGKGEIDWAVKIPKRQMSVDDGGFYSSYAMAINRDKIHFIYNDNPNNLDYTGVGKVSSAGGRNQVVIVASVNARGEVTRQPLGAGNSNIIIRPKVCEQISYSEMILFGQKKRTQQFGKIVFE
jgi:hypothetical protein